MAVLDPPWDGPADGRYVLKRATVPACLMEAGLGRDGLVQVDIVVDRGRIASVSLHDPASPGIDLDCRMVWPCPVDLHAHLDKGHIWPRAANPDGTFGGALAAVTRDRVANWSAADVRARFEFGLRCAYAHGTRAIRTHLDSVPPQDTVSWPLFAELRAAWAGRIELQAVSLALPEHYAGEAGRTLARRVAEHGGVLGLLPVPGPELDADLDRFLALAAAHGLDIDCHIDETLDPASEALLHLAEAMLRNRFQGRAVAGHCCALSRQAPDRVRRTLDRVAEAGIAIVSLPMCNLYLQDRVAGRTPRLRGVTLVHELEARDIPLAFASDNCRDPFYAYGDHDLLEVFREAVRIAHLDHPIGDWPAAVTVTPANVMGLPDHHGLAPGMIADLLIFEGRDWSEVLSRPQSGRVVLRSGRRIDTIVPDYRELDFLRPSV